MKKIMKKSLLLLAILGCVSTAQAEYMMKFPIDNIIIKKSTGWELADPLLGPWTNTGDIYGCSNWSPVPSSVTINQSFIQTATDCQQNQLRSKQPREQESQTKKYRNAGSPYNESQTINISSTRSEIGTKETWALITPTYTEWTNSDNIEGCSNWSPSTDTLTITQSFTQTATDCQQPQTRVRQDREQESTTGNIRNKGGSVTEKQNIATSSTRSATGTKETWVASTPAYTTWANSSAATGCSNWSPATNTVTYGTDFTQTATDCKQDQTRSKQEREQETTTKAYRNLGVAVSETQNITTSSTRTATGTKENWVIISPTYTDWVNSGAATGCTNWSPDASTVNAGQTFTQTATNCKQTQTRTRQDREQESVSKAIRNVGTPATETQTITSSSTQEAKGVKAIPKVCAYGNSSWAYVPPNLTLTWKETTTPVAERFAIVIPLSSTSYIKDGYLYTKGTGQFAQGSNIYSQICRQPI